MDLPFVAENFRLVGGDLAGGFGRIRVPQFRTQPPSEFGISWSQSSLRLSGFCEIVGCGRGMYGLLQHFLDTFKLEWRRRWAGQQCGESWSRQVYTFLGLNACRGSRG
jgi:hypothetical protein